MSTIHQMLLAGGPDTTPNAFSFTSRTGINPSTVVTSNTVTLSGFDVAVSWSCSGGTASVAGGAYASSGSISPGQTVVVRVISSASNSTTTSATFTAGGVSGTFSVTTAAPAAVPSMTIGSYTPNGGYYNFNITTTNTTNYDIQVINETTLTQVYTANSTNLTTLQVPQANMPFGYTYIVRATPKNASNTGTQVSRTVTI